jgi:ABC-type branched-subunit amino acid transport system permease subunit
MHQKSVFAVGACSAALCGSLLANLTSELSPGSISYTRTSQRLS